MVDIRVRRSSGERYRERQRISARSKTAATRWGEQREHHLIERGPTPKAREVPTLQTFAPRFLEGYAKANRHKPSGIAQKEIALRVHLAPLFGLKRLDSITNEDVQRLKHQMREKSAKTTNNVLTVLGKLLKVAVEWGVLERMPCSIRLLKTPEGSMRFWDVAEYQRLVEAAQRQGSDVLVAVLLGGEAGLRAGEMRALEWTDIDFNARKLFVARSEWRGQIGTTKGNRMRVVPMTTRLADALRRHRSLKGLRVLVDRNGQPLSANALTYLIERATRSAGLATTRKPKGAGPHVLRHTFCSHLAMKGAPARSIQELAGHRDLTTTQRYMHLSPAAIDSAIRLLEVPTTDLARGNREATAFASS
ncbi:MAG: tyrosine-type recombinase/integrase [Vicinamibacterales bacterium]